MTRGTTELTLDGSAGIRWAPWRFTEPLVRAGWNLLSLEPLPLPPGELASRRLLVEHDDTVVSWSWAGWERAWVRRVFCDGLTDDDPEGGRILDATMAPRIPWSALPDCDAVEITPWEPTAGHGATVRIPRPLGVPRCAVSLGLVAADLLEIGVGARTGRRLRAALVVDRGGRSAVLAEQDLERTGGQVPVSPSFQGWVVVVADVRGRSRLVDAARLDTQRLTRPQPDRIRWLRDALEIAREGAPWPEAQPWPAFTWARLRGLTRQATMPEIFGGRRSARDHALDQHLTGSFRVIALSALGLDVSGRAEELAAALDAGTFEQALIRRWPGAAAPLEHAGTDDEAAWVVRHVEDPHLLQTVAWSAGRGVAGLDAARAMVDHRTALLALLDQLRPGTPLEVHLRGLLDEVEQAVHFGAPPPGLAGKVEALRQRVAAEQEL